MSTAVVMQEHSISANEKIWYAPQWLGDPVEQIFSLAYWSAQHRVTGSAQGRGTTWFVQTVSLPAALRHYRRGGLLGKLVNDHYCFLGWHNTRSYQEFKLLEFLRAAGVNVPRPIAARVIKRGLWYQADLLSEKIENAQDLVTVLTKRALTAAEYQRIGVEIGKMHQAGVNHTDLNIHNILLDKQGQVWLIDFDKCHQEKQAGRWQKKNIERLQRSFKKEQKKRHIHWQAPEFELLLASYLQVSE